VNLVRAELQRLLARRFTQVMLIVMLGAFGITFATAVANTHTPTQVELNIAQNNVDQQREYLITARAECEARRAEALRSGNIRFAEDCRSLDPDQVHLEQFLDGVFVFSESVPSLVFFLASFLALFGVLVGASFVGAELTSGGMTNLLLWRPRRASVLGAKLGTLLGTVAVISIVGIAGYVGVFWALAEASGLPGNLDGPFWTQLGLVCLRAWALALVFTAIGFGIATLGRHTAAALGVLAGYAVLWEIGARIVLYVIRWPHSEALMLSNYIAAWMVKRITLFDTCSEGSCGSYTLTLWHSAAVFAAILALVVGGAFLNFRRRDIA